MTHRKKFKELRVKLGLRREQLAVELNVSTSAIWNVENINDHNSSIRLVLKYVKFFDVPLESLIDTANIELGE